MVIPVKHGNQIAPGSRGQPGIDEAMREVLFDGFGAWWRENLEQPD